MLTGKKAFLLFLLASVVSLSGQTIMHRDSKISGMVNELSTNNLKATVQKLVGFGTRHSFSTNEDDIRGITAACKWVNGEFDKIAIATGGRFEAVWDTFTVNPDGRRILKKEQMINVIGRLKGNNKEDKRVFLVSGHIDSRNGSANDTKIDAPGANDDASGVALVVELARIMSKYNFPADIVFTVVSGEEQGLYGSTHIAEKAKEENWNIEAMLNNDMVGNSGSSGNRIEDNIQVRVFSEGIPAFETDRMKRERIATSGENDSKSRQLARYIKEVGERYVDNIEVKLIYRSDRFLRGGDQSPFSRNGFTAVRLTEMNENFDRQHQNIREENGIKYGDVIEFVDFEYVRKIAAINLAVIANANLAPGTPVNAAIEVREVANNTKIKWETPGGTAPDGYYVLMRETSSPVWQKKFFVKGNELMLPYSKDNYFFAVQSVDKEGHESLPVFPAIARN